MISSAEAHALAAQVPSGASVDRAANRIRFSGSAIQLPLVAGADGSPMMSFTVAGLVNPTIVVPSGAQITVRLVNADDDMAHGWVLTTVSPPYPYMGGMMSGWGPAGGMTGGEAAVVPLAAASNSGMSRASVTFSTPTPGSYWYLCQVPGHAQRGMYGQFQVL